MRSSPALPRTASRPTPTLVLWGAPGVVHSCFQPLQEEWQRVATQVQGEALPCDYCIAEESPNLLLQQVQPFFAQPADGA